MDCSQNTSTGRICTALLLVTLLALGGAGCETMGSGDKGDDTGGDKQAVVAPGPQYHLA